LKLEAPFELAPHSVTELEVTVTPFMAGKPISGNIFLFVGDPDLREFDCTFDGEAEK
jgi:hypothetical protein